jgi:hypothetical protein
MDYIIILLATLLVVIITYMLSVNYFSSTTKLSGEIDMKDKTADILSDKLTRPDATRYSYNIWLYLDKPIADSKTVFNRANDLGLILNGTTSVMSVRLYRRGTSGTTDPKDIQISNNFPLQKWVLVTISVDNSTIDIYLDGKLIKSVVDNKDSIIPFKSHIADATSPITFAQMNGAYMTKFSRTVSPTDPQTAWNLYMEGSGSKKGLGSLVNRYNVNVAILKDNNPLNVIPLW